MKIFFAFTLVLALGLSGISVAQEYESYFTHIGTAPDEAEAYFTLIMAHG